jgi:hypothetical protein
MFLAFVMTTFPSGLLKTNGLTLSSPFVISNISKANSEFESDLLSNKEEYFALISFSLDIILISLPAIFPV